MMDENKVQDLRLAYEFERKFSEFKNADEGRFTSEISQEKRYRNDRVQFHKENDTVSYSRGEDYFKYEILSETGDNNTTIKYENGSKSIVISTKTGVVFREKTEESNDATELAFINSLMEYMPYSHMHVTDIADLDDIKFFATSECTINMGTMEDIIYKISFLKKILEEPGDKRGAVIDMTNPQKVTYRGS